MAMPQENMAVGPDAVTVRVGVAGMSVIVCHDRSVPKALPGWNHIPVTVS
jgi:hypothetical protein